jgi:hypothetical protein
VRLTVNNHTVLTIPAKTLATNTTYEFELGAPARKYFRLGQNEIQVAVAKGKVPTSVGACNTGSLSRLAGVLFGLAGRTSADLSVSAGKAPVQYVRGSAYAFNGTFTVRNAGPSAAVPGYFNFTVQIGFLEGVINTVTSSIKASTQFGHCTNDDLKVECPFGVLPAGASATVSFQVVVRFPPTSRSATSTRCSQTGLSIPSRATRPIRERAIRIPRTTRKASHLPVWPRGDGPEVPFNRRQLVRVG